MTLTQNRKVSTRVKQKVLDHGPRQIMNRRGSGSEDGPHLLPQGLTTTARVLKHAMREQTLPGLYIDAVWCIRTIFSTLWANTKRPISMLIREFTPTLYLYIGVPWFDLEFGQPGGT